MHRIIRTIKLLFNYLNTIIRILLLFSFKHHIIHNSLEILFIKLLKNKYLCFKIENYSTILHDRMYLHK